MNLVHIGAVFIRVIAVMALVMFVRTTAAGLAYNWAGGILEAHIGYFASAVVWLVAAVLLWMFALKMSGAISSFAHNRDQVVGPLNAEDLEVVLIAVLGMYFLFMAAVDLTYWASAFVWYERIQGVDLDFGPDEKATLTRSIAQMVFAFVLVLRARGISNLIRGLREAGQD